MNKIVTAIPRFLAALAIVLIVAGAKQATAMELHWSGQFTSDFNWVHNYSLDGTDQGALVDPARDGKGGYYIPGGGSRDARWEQLFLRLRPKLIVNDNIYVKSEWWVGDPVFGIFGNAVPSTVDQKQFYSNQSRGSSITAQRVWGEFITDFGTLQVGRAPLNWGLGLVWNAGEDRWSRYMTTADTARLVSRFGAFSLVPTFALYSTGNTIGGACNYAGGVGTACNSALGSGSVSEYSLILNYETDEDIELGVNFIRRLGAANQDVNGFYGFRPVGAGQEPIGFNYNTWDLYGRKKIGKLQLAAEVPIVNGELGGVEYKTFALGAQADWRASDQWETQLRLGHAPGQGTSLSASPDKFRGFFFHPNYKVGLILFNYQLANFSGPQTLNSSTTPAELRSPYDASIFNTNYLGLSETFRADKWDFYLGLLHARAIEVANAGQFFYNQWERRYVPTPAAKTQGDVLGTEVDWGAVFNWDDYFRFKADFGLFFPGSFYAFSNAAVDNLTDTVFAASLRVGIDF